MAKRKICEILYKELLTSNKRDEDFLGEGGFGVVLRCYHKKYGSVAVKLMKSSDKIHILKQKFASGLFNNEIAIHEKTSCQYIVSALGYTSYLQNIGIVFEYMSMGTLSEVIREANTLPWSFKVRTVYEIASGINHLHNLDEHSRMTHNDIKPENILFDSNLHAKVSDFGGASFGKHTTILNSTSVTTQATDQRASNVYTLIYIAPELLKGGFQIPRSCSMDVYSFSLVIFCIIYQHLPYMHKSDALVRNAIERNQRPIGDSKHVQFEANVDEYACDSLLSTMKKMWAIDHKVRPKIGVIQIEFATLLKLYSNDTIHKDISNLKNQLVRLILPETDPNSRISVFEKNRILLQSSPLLTTRAARSSVPKQDITLTSNTVVEQTIVVEGRENQRRTITNPTNSVATERLTEDKSKKTIVKLLDPNFKVDDKVIIKYDSTTKGFENVQNISAGDISKLDGKCGRIHQVINKELLKVCINDEYHTVHIYFLRKIKSIIDLSVGDVVQLSMDKDLVKKFQKDHGGWTDDMDKYFNEPGLVFKFFTNNSDVLVVYRDGSHFRFNPTVLEKVNELTKQNFLRNPTGDLTVGDFVHFSMDGEMIKQFQNGHGGWADEMEPLRNRVGVVIYIDFCGRVYVAYSSKLCFMFNSAVFTKISPDDAVRWNSEFERKAKKAVQVKLVNATATRPNAVQSGFKIGDKVKICLPIDIVIPLQMENSGWLYQMLEVYGKCGVIVGFNCNKDVQIVFGKSRWTFCQAVLAKSDTVVEEDCMPPFLIGDRVKMKVPQDLPNLSENELVYQMRRLEVSDKNIDILTQGGKVVGIDRAMYVVVEFDSGRKVGLKMNQLQKIP